MQVIGTAGHVDHGKSTLVERLTGIDPDRFAEEKRRGLTIDLGFAWLPLPSGREIGLIDVPGHERFIKNMLAGAGGISVCLFVVAANEGWMPQSAEHLAILDILDIQHGVVAVTKSDTVDGEILDLAVAEVEEHIAASSLKNAPVVPCSALSGEGIDELVQAIDNEVAAAPPAPDAARPRLWIDRVFTIAGAGTVVTGTLAGGSLATGEAVEISPEGRRARVRSIQSHKKEVRQIASGNRVALNLAGLERQGARRGDAIVRPDQWRPTTLVDVNIRVLGEEITGTNHELTDKGAHLLYVGSAETPVRLQLLERSPLKPGDVSYAQIFLRNPLPLQRGDRFVLRDAGRVLTFGGGEVLDPLPRPARGDRAGRARLLARLSSASPSEALEALVESQGAIDASEAFFRSGTDEPSPSIMRLGALLVSKERFDLFAATVQQALVDHHGRHPLEQGMPREALRATTKLPPNAFDDLVDRLQSIAEVDSMLRLTSFSVELGPEQQRLRYAVIKRIEDANFTPPLVSELGADEALLRSLTASGELVKIGDFYLTRAGAARARKLVRARIEQKGPLTVAEIRDVLGTTRKYAVPLCEWLDATKATRRQGDLRALGPVA